ncbi:response regulator [Candidatus Nitrospira bockiana]
MSLPAAILIIDADPASLAGLEGLFRTRLAGTRLVLPSTLAESLDHLDTGTYDLILCDPRVPGAQGFELLAKIRSVKPETPLIAMLGSSRPDAAHQALGAGASDVVLKPFDRESLLAKLEDVLKRAQGAP